MDKSKYLKRIGISGISKPDIEFLNKLHRAHLYNIPFENLDIHNGRKIVLDEKSIYKKLIDDKRGGYCYELNGLFGLLFRELGYKVSLISAKVNDGKGGWGEEFDHLLILVETDNSQWIADVGFGDSFIEPLKFETDKPVKQTNWIYRITAYDDGIFLLSKSADDNVFTDEFIFTTIDRRWDEFSGMNIFHQTSPESHFTRKKVCTMPDDTGRTTLSGDKLIITRSGKKEITLINSDAEFNEALYKYFNMKI